MLPRQEGQSIGLGRSQTSKGALAFYPQSINRHSQPEGAMDTAEIDKIEPPGMQRHKATELSPTAQMNENRWLSCEGQTWLART